MDFSVHQNNRKITIERAKTSVTGLAFFLTVNAA